QLFAADPCQRRLHLHCGSPHTAVAKAGDHPGPRSMSMASELRWDGASPQPFRIAIDEAVLIDGKERLHKTRWPDEIPGEPWAYGTDLGYLKALCAYWRDTYDWRKQEAEVNRFKHYTAVIGGSAVHFIHEPGEGPNPRPLLLP